MRRILAVAGVSAGCVLLSPVVASAQDPYPGSPTSMTVTVAGNAVTIKGTCAADGVEAEAGYDFYRGQRPIESGVMTLTGKTYSITFTGVQPGAYVATMYCRDGGTGSRSQHFTVGKPAQSTPTPTPAKPTAAKPAAKPAPQVAVKPHGAPQTGGGPAEDESGGTALVAGGAIALVGASTWTLRRRSADRR